jgi:hypothetical protein
VLNDSCVEDGLYFQEYECKRFVATGISYGDFIVREISETQAILEDLMLEEHTACARHNPARKETALYGVFGKIQDPHVLIQKPNDKFVPVMAPDIPTGNIHV